MNVSFKERHQMKYTKEERLKIGKEIFENRINIYEASIIYSINEYTARDYYRLYKAYINCNKDDD